MIKLNILFTNSNAIKTIDQFRIAYCVITIWAFLITEAGRNIYRPYIYANNINDFGIADSIGNLGGIIVQIFFVLTILNSPKLKAYSGFILMIGGYILYEVLQLYLPRGVFDLKDIYGTIIGGAFAIIIFSVLHTLIKKNHIFYKF